MALSPFNDNIQVNANKPIDNKYYKNGLTIYASVSEANTTIVSAYRYRGLTVAINVSGTITEYWWFAGIADGDLVVKNLGQVPSTRTIQGDDTISGGGDLSANRTLVVVPNKTNQKVGVHYNSNGTVVGTRKAINIIPGTNVTASVVDDSVNDWVSVTINATGGGGGGMTIEQKTVAIAVAATTVSVTEMIGADGVFPVFVFPTPLLTSTTNTVPAVDEVYANTTTGLYTFGTALSVGQKVTFMWYRS